MENLRHSIVTLQTPPNLAGQPSVDLRKRDFDATIWNKSYDVYVDKSIKCPCRNIPDHQAQVDCRNCGGTGYVFINRMKTRAVLQSMNMDTKFKEWSEEKVGMGKLTFLNRERVTFMDKITILNSEMLTTEVLHPKIWTDNKLMCRTIYPIKEVEFCFLFISVNQRLQRLREGEDFTIEEDQYLVINNMWGHIENCTITLRYLHLPVYHVIDLARAVMTTPEFDKSVGEKVDSDMPLLANVRLAHFVLNQNTYNGDWLLDNTDYEFCKDGKLPIKKDVCTPVTP